MEDVNRRRRNFICLFLAWIWSLEISATFDNCKIGIIASKTERTHIHFLCHVFFAIASLDLKVPNTAVCLSKFCLRPTSSFR